MSDLRSELKLGRAAFSRRNWGEAHTTLAAADSGTPLAPADLELLATAAFMLGREEEHVLVLERAQRAYADTGDERKAAHCACWMGINLAQRREWARASGWFARAQRLLDQGSADCVERGYLLTPAMMQGIGGGEFDAAFDVAGRAAEIGRRFADGDLVAISLHVQGRARLKQGRIAEGLPLLDEAMVAVLSDELSPIVTGLVYCSVIEGCQEVFELGRAREWTEALSRWCQGQTELVSFTGKCLMHRAEIMQARGEWQEALAEARSACERLDRDAKTSAVGPAMYRQGEIHRVRGELGEAEAAYAHAARAGWEPQPGLALTRLAQGDAPAARAAIRRALGEALDEGARLRLLPAQIEIALALGELDDARSACAELEGLAEGAGNDVLSAMASYGRGAVALADGDAWAALNVLRDSVRRWDELQAPYEAARARLLVAGACQAVGDKDTAAMELEAVCSVLKELGAKVDLAHAEDLAARTRSENTHGLSPRELEVLRLIARGDTNKAIAAELVISERTVDRHVSNILAKLRLSSRSAATAFAYEHELL